MLFPYETRALTPRRINPHCKTRGPYIGSYSLLEPENISWLAHRDLSASFDRTDSRAHSYK